MKTFLQVEVFWVVTSYSDVEYQRFENHAAMKDSNLVSYKIGYVFYGLSPYVIKFYCPGFSFVTEIKPKIKYRFRVAVILLFYFSQKYRVIQNERADFNFFFQTNCIRQKHIPHIAG
jgi:hypothetical protein